MTAKKRIIFLKATANPIKTALLCDVIRQHFQKGQAILVSVPNAEVAEYVDKLLWSKPEESFIPHTISQTATNEQVVITTKTDNINKAAILFNLCPLASSMVDQFEITYEYHDETHPDKLKLSQDRRSAYAAAGHDVSDAQ